LDERGLKEVVASVIGRDATLDDCAVLPIGDEYLVATTDMLHESTDFPRGMTEREIGWMGAAVTLSDIAAMGARPSLVLLAVGLDSPSRLEGILVGARDCCRAYGAALAGGDLDAHGELTLVSSGIGFTKRPVRRCRRPGRRPGGSRRGPREGAGGPRGVQRVPRVPGHPEAPPSGRGLRLRLPVSPP